VWVALDGEVAEDVGAEVGLRSGLVGVGEPSGSAGGVVLGGVRVRLVSWSSRARRTRSAWGICGRRWRRSSVDRSARRGWVQPVRVSRRRATTWARRAKLIGRIRNLQHKMRDKFKYTNIQKERSAG